MTDFPLKKLLKRFAIVYPLACVGMGVLTILIEKFTGLHSNAGTNFIPIWLSGMDMGQNFFKQVGRVPEKNESWRMARWATLLVMVISFAMMVLIFALFPDDLALVFATIGILGLIIGLLIIGLLSFVVIRLFIGLGARGLAKAELRKMNKR